jgi:hypothetical protein
MEINSNFSVYISIIYLSYMGDKRNAYKNLVGKSEREKPLGISRRRWEDNIKMEIEYGVTN